MRSREIPITIHINCTNGGPDPTGVPHTQAHTHTHTEERENERERNRERYRER